MEKARRIFNHCFLTLALALSSSLMLSERLLECSIPVTAEDHPTAANQTRQPGEPEFQFDDRLIADNPDKG